MRVALGLLVIAALVAGCTNNDGQTTTPTPSTTTPPVTSTPETTPTPSATPTPSTPEPTAPTVTPTPTTPTPEPFVNISLRHDYGNASENLTFFVPAGVTGLVVSIQFDAAPTAVPGQSACAGALRLKVTRPDGSLQFDATASPGTAPSGTELHCGIVSAGGTFPTDVPPGDWHADFSGQGVGIGWVRVEKAS